MKIGSPNTGGYIKFTNIIILVILGPNAKYLEVKILSIDSGGNVKFTPKYIIVVGVGVLANMQNVCSHIRILFFK
jgi:hypothetical protein